MRLSPIIVLVALAAGCGPSTDTTGPCALPVDDLPVLGPSDAPVTIVEFSDFQCPYCGMMEPALAKLMTDYAGKVRLAYEHMPLAFHAYAYAAAVAAVCADDQGQFWPMHDLLFAHQSALDDASLAQYAGTLPLDVAAWTACFAGGDGNTAMSSGKTAAAVITSNEAASTRAKVDGTPTLFVNGARSVGAVQYSTLKSLVDTALAAAEASTVPAADYYAHVVSTVGCSP
jgi:protein-disulfide isomerase